MSQKLELTRISGPFIDFNEGQHPTAEFRLIGMSNEPKKMVTSLSFAAFSSDTDISPIYGTERQVVLNDTYFRNPRIHEGVVVDYGYPSFNYVWSLIQTNSKGEVSIIPGKETEIFAFLLNEPSLNVKSHGSTEEKLGDGWQIKTTV